MTLAPHPLVVVVDDEPMLVDLVCDALEEDGIAALGCSAAAEAFWFIGRSVPKVVILDVQMPGVNGIQLFEQLRADPELTQTAVIFLTANRHLLERQLPEYAQHGATLVEKPFELTTLLSCVEDALTTAAARQHS